MEREDPFDDRERRAGLAGGEERHRRQRDAGTLTSRGRIDVLPATIVKTMNLAVNTGAPVVGLHDAGGARIQEGVRVSRYARYASW
jgi:acetyl-CoA carboxylase carboxyltransferase component